MHILIALACLLAVFSMSALSAEAPREAYDLAAQKFQSDTAAAAAGVAGQIATVQGSVMAADSYIAAGQGLQGLCDTMARDPRRAYQRLTVFTVNANLRCSTVPDARDQPDVILQRQYFQSALATGDDQVGGPLLSAFSGRASLTFAHPVRNSGSMVGVAVGATDVSDLVRPVTSKTHAQRVLIAGRDGGRFELGATEPPQVPQPLDEAVNRALATGEPCPVVTLDGLAWTCAAVGRAGLVLLVAYPEHSIFAAYFAALDRQWIRSAGIVVVAVGTALLIDFLFLRRIRVAYGNAGLSGLRAVDATSRDEVDALADWSREAETNLRRLREELEVHERRRLNSERDLLTSIAETVEIRYPFLRNHGDRVGRYARQIGARLGIAGGDLDLLEFAARVHDLGKIAIADAVYLKPGRLEPIEAAQMQLHAARGGEIAGRMRTVPPQVADAIRHHHERWDGRGYPDGLAGTEIPLWSRVIAVADAYDAMTEERPYRPQPRTHDEAIQILKEGAGSQWDTTAVHAFLEVLELGTVQPKPAPMPVRRIGGTGA